MSVIRPAGLQRGPTLITDKLAHPMNFSMAKPARGNRYFDPQFNQVVTRVTDVAAQFPGSTICCPVYSTMPAWNADMTQLVVYVTPPGEHWLINMTTLQVNKQLNISVNAIENVAWHPIDPLLIRYTDGSTIKSRNIVTDADTTLFTAGGAITFGSDPMYTSWDGDLFGLAQGSNAFTRRISTGASTGNIAAAGLGAMIAPSGSYYIANGNVYTAGGTSLLRAMTLNTEEHACMTRTTDGRDLWVACQFGGTYDGATVVAENIVTGEITRWITDTQGWPYTPGTTHISGVGLQSPGQVAVSCVGYPASYDGILQLECLVVDVNGPGLVGRVCHNHSIPGGQPDPFNYFAEPHIIIAPNGRRAIFGSNWGTAGTTIDVYMVEW